MRAETCGKVRNRVAEKEQPVSTSEPIKPAPDREEIVVSRSTVYYTAIAILFFVAGYIVAWAVFSTTTGSLLTDVKNAASSGANEAVATGIARLGNGAVAVAPPTPTPIPKQDINPGDSPAWGPANSRVTIVTFSDFQCPYCEAFYKDTYQLLKQRYGDKIRFVFKDFPLDQHPQARPAAYAGQCANEQGKFWEYHDVLFQNQADLSEAGLIRYAQQVGVADIGKFTECYKTQKYKARIDADVQYGMSKFVGGTPTFYINGQYAAGVLNFQLLAGYLDGLLAQPA